jgi:hypothetical protein
VEPQPHKKAFVQGAARKRRRDGQHVHIVVKSIIVLLHKSRLNKTRFMSQNTGIIMAAVPAISSEATQENITDGRDFWAVSSRPEFLILLSIIIE